MQICRGILKLSEQTKSDLIWGSQWKSTLPTTYVITLPPTIHPAKLASNLGQTNRDRHCNTVIARLRLGYRCLWQVVTHEEVPNPENLVCKFCVRSRNWVMISHTTSLYLQSLDLVVWGTSSLAITVLLLKTSYSLSHYVTFHIV